MGLSCNTWCSAKLVLMPAFCLIVRLNREKVSQQNSKKLEEFEKSSISHMGKRERNLPISCGWGSRLKNHSSVSPSGSSLVDRDLFLSPALETFIYFSCTDPGTWAYFNNWFSSNFFIFIFQVHPYESLDTIWILQKPWLWNTDDEHQEKHFKFYWVASIKGRFLIHNGYCVWPLWILQNNC